MQGQKEILQQLTLPKQLILQGSGDNTFKKISPKQSGFKKKNNGKICNKISQDYRRQGDSEQKHIKNNNTTK